MFDNGNEMWLHTGMTRNEAKQIGKEALRAGFGAQLREDLATDDCYLLVTNRAGRDRSILNQQDWDNLKQFEVAR